jgi:2-polyprenyl-3-methyl-5-hydroxy-6-metoxy-1,4-benzoquinol methylase
METKTLHVCPWWMGYFLIHPLRRYYQNPDQILRHYVTAGMKVVDYGCAMGYFSLPMARMVGNTGRVYAIDIQQKMLDFLVKRAAKAGLNDIITPELSGTDSFFTDLKGQIDFVLLFAMVHEVPDQGALFSDVANLLKGGSLALFAEPRGHVSAAEFENSIGLAVNAGFEVLDRVMIRGSHAVTLQKQRIR